jgi:hypothetical protein
MDDNKEKLGNIEFREIQGSPVIKSDSSVFPESFYFSKFYDEKAYSKFIKNIEKTVRSSREYKSYIELLRSNVSALNFDNILTNVTNADTELEFHHHPLTLYEVVDMVCTNRFLKKEKFTSLSIAKEVMNLHYRNVIGLVPLSKTNHELAHFGRLAFSRKQIFGDYEKLVEEFKESISVDLRDKINKVEELTKSNSPSDIGGIF